jgi:hypothetical protein
MEFKFYRIIRTAIVKMTFFEMFVVLHRVLKKEVTQHRLIRDTILKKKYFDLFAVLYYA